MVAGSTPPDPFFSSLPVWAQYAASLGIFVAAVLAGAFGFAKQWLSKPPQQQLLIQNAAEADITPFRDMVEVSERIHRELQKLAEIGQGFLELFRDEAEEKRIEREVEKRVREHIAKATDQQE